MQEDNAPVTEVGPVQRCANRLGRREPDRASEDGADHVRDRDVLEPHLERDNERTEHRAELEVRKRPAGKRLELERE